MHMKSIICPLRGTYFPIFIPVLIQKAMSLSTIKHSLYLCVNF